MNNRREKEINQRQNRELMDRLEQVQLTEEWVQPDILWKMDSNFLRVVNFYVGLISIDSFTGITVTIWAN
jgi:hypothetical protein